MVTLINLHTCIHNVHIGCLSTAYRGIMRKVSCPLVGVASTYVPAVVHRRASVSVRSFQSTVLVRHQFVTDSSSRSTDVAAVPRPCDTLQDFSLTALVRLACVLILFMVSPRTAETQCFHPSAVPTMPWGEGAASWAAKILVGWATLHLAPPIIGLYVC